MKFTPEACALIREYLMYDPVTGWVRWRKHSGGTGRAGRRAGTVHNHTTKEKMAAGYRAQFHRIIGLRGVDYGEHQIAFLLMTGSVPRLIDHRNCDGTNNVWSNIRPATRAQNMQNKRLSVRNKTGCTGIYYVERDCRFRATITINGVRRSLGYFGSLTDAVSVRRAAEIKHFGEFVPQKDAL